MISTGDARGVRKRVFVISNSSFLSYIWTCNSTFFRLGDLAKINFINSSSGLRFPNNLISNSFRCSNQTSEYSSKIRDCSSNLSGSVSSPSSYPLIYSKIIVLVNFGIIVK
ncbi:hypothetical protein Hanom_Chr17g01547721 [Helianthus anomalus]